MHPTDPPPPPLRARPFAGARALRLTTRERLRGPAYQHLMRGAFWVAGGDVTYERRLQALRAVVPPHSVLGGPSAAWALGARWAGPDEVLEIVLPPSRRIRSRDGVRVRGDVLPPGEVVATSLGPATSPARTAFDLARRPPPQVAVARLDALLRATGVAVATVREVAARHPRAEGRRRLDPVLDLVDPGAESPKESELRLLLVLAGLPPPVTQHAVRDGSGRVVARLDLAWPQRRAGADYDGADHRERHRHSRDLARHNALRALGWAVVQVDAVQLRRPDRVVALVSRLLEEQRPRPPPGAASADPPTPPTCRRRRLCRPSAGPGGGGDLPAGSGGGGDGDGAAPTRGGPERRP